MTIKVGGIEFDIDVDASGVKRAVTTSVEDLEKLQKKLAATDPAAKGAGNSLKGLGRNAGQAGIQIQQFVGQIQGGQSAMLALSQQGADLGIVLGKAGLGAAIGIGATALSFLIPALTDAEEETTDLRDRIRELGEEVKLTSNQIKFLGRDNSKAADEMSEANVKAFNKIRELREELEKMQSAGTGLDTGQFAVPRSAEENQRRYAKSIEEANIAIQDLQTKIDTNNQSIKSLADETRNLGGETELLSKESQRYNTSLQAQVIALEHGAQAAEVYAAVQRAVINGEEGQLQKTIELINKKYELKRAQEQSVLASRAEIEEQRAYSSILDEIFAKEEARTSQKAMDAENASKKLDSFRQSLMSEEQLRAEYYNRELEQFLAAAEILGLSKDETRELERQKAQQHAEELIAIEEKRAKKEQDIEDAKNRAKLSALSGIFGNLSSLMNTESRKLFEIGKASAIAGAIVDTFAAATKALKELPTPLNYAAAAAVAVKGFANVRQIQSTNFGSAGAGQSYQGGQVVNNTQQQPQQVTQRNISISLAGSGSFTGGDIRGLINSINEELGDGATLSIAGG